MALIRAGAMWRGIGIGKRSIPSALFASRICQSRTQASKWPFLLFSPSVTIKEKREGDPQIVSFLSRVFPVSVMIVISSLDFFLWIGTLMEKLKNSLYGSSEISHKLNFHPS